MAINWYNYHQCKKRTPIKKLNVIKNSEVKEHPLKIIVSKDLEPDNILEIFLNFTNFEPCYSYKIYSYKKKSVMNV